MANQYTLNNDFSAITETQGTLYNPSASNIELASAASTPKGQGILLLTGERRTFSGTLYARSMDTAATLNVSDFTDAAEGGGDAADVRQPSTAYALGDVRLLPVPSLTKKMVCVKAGTSGSGDLTLSSTAEGTIVTDGGAKWAVDSLADGIYTPDHLNGIARGAEIQFTWAELSAKKTAGDFTGLHIGDYKEITLTGGEKVVMELAGISNFKNFADSAIGDHLDFISRDSLATYMQWNTTATNNGTADKKCPWLASALYDSLNNASTGVYSKLPSDLKPYVIQKRTLLEERYSAGGAATADTSWSWQNAGYLWLPTEVEVFDHPVWSEPGYGTGFSRQYPIFRLMPSRIIKRKGKGGSRDAWWELSVYRGNSSHVCHVTYAGTAYNYSAAHTGICAPLCFRI